MYSVNLFLVGIMNHSSLYPCLYCTKYKDKNGNWVGDGKLRTWLSIKQNKHDWETIGKAKKSTRKNFFNCVNEPLIGDGTDTPILDTVAPPPLHLKLALNSILEALLEVWPELELWMEMIHIAYAPYFGTVLEGNESEKFLRKLDELALWIPSEFEQFLSLLKALKSVIESCFRARGLSPDFQVLIRHEFYFNSLMGKLKESI